MTVALPQTSKGTHSFTVTILPKRTLLSFLNLGVDHWWKTLLPEQGVPVRKMLTVIWDCHLLTQAVRILSSYSQQPCTAVWVLRNLEMYSQCPDLAPCQWKYQIWFYQEFLLEVVTMDSTWDSLIGSYSGNPQYRHVGQMARLCEVSAGPLGPLVFICKIQDSGQWPIRLARHPSSIIQ